MNKKEALFLDFEDNISFSVNHENWYQVIRCVRKGFGKTQALFAKELGVSQSQIGRYESGTIEPPLKFWKSFLKKYDLNFEWVLFGTGQPHSSFTEIQPEALEYLKTEYLKDELKRRKKTLDGCILRAEKIQKDIHQQGPKPSETLEEYEDRIKREQRKTLPIKAPKWLVDDFEMHIK